MYVVYALVDPRDNKPFYVGMTDDVYARFLQHLRCDGSNFRKDARIHELKDKQLMVIMQVLEHVETVDRTRMREAYWIHHYLQLGITLYNNHLPTPMEHKVQNVKRFAPPNKRKKAPRIPKVYLPVDDTIVQQMIKDGISRADMIFSLWGVSSEVGGDAYSKTVRELATIISRIVKSPNPEMDERTRRICQMLKDGEINSKIIKEIWGVSSRQGGDAYKKAARELSDIMSSLV